MGRWGNFLRAIAPGFYERDSGGDVAVTTMGLASVAPVTVGMVLAATPAAAEPEVFLSQPSAETPLHAALQRLSFSYETQFSRIEGDQAFFFPGMSFETTKSVPCDRLPEFMGFFEEEKELFVEMKRNGTAEVEIPKDVNFPLHAGPFSESRETPPPDRPSVRGFSGDREVFSTTKDRVAIDDVIFAYDCILREIATAMREAAGKRIMPPAAPARLKLVPGSR